MTFGRMALLAAALAATTIATPAIAERDRSPADRGSEAQCSITVEPDGSLSGSVVDTPLDQVLARLASRIGASIRWAEPHGRWAEPHGGTRSTLSFRRLSVTDAIARLLVRYNYMVLFTRDGTGRARTEIRIGSSIDAPADATGDTTAIERTTARTAAFVPSGAAGSHASVAARDRSPVVAPADPRDLAGLESVSRLVDLEKGTEGEPLLRKALAEALARNDAEGVERATSLGLGALPDATLESAARADDSLRPVAIDLLARRAEHEPQALAALSRLAEEDDAEETTP
jgi:hypothetical protein